VLEKVRRGMANLGIVPDIRDDVRDVKTTGKWQNSEVGLINIDCSKVVSSGSSFRFPARNCPTF
jgi:hypothetical protein